MKKILLALLVVSVVSFTSCKKDAETTPVKSLKVNGGPGSQISKTDVYSYD